jgi:hypothetical protein
VSIGFLPDMEFDNIPSNISEANDKNCSILLLEIFERFEHYKRFIEN